jgi:hypothetical protein
MVRENNPGSSNTISNASMLTINDSTVEANFGHGIGNFGTLILQRNTVRDNSGAGIFNFNGSSATIDRTTISGNTQSGGILNSGAAMVAVSNSTVSGNTGGGITGSVSTLLVSNSTISGNTGGGIQGSGSAAVSNCTIHANPTSSGDGAGINFTGNALLRNTIVANHARGNCAGGIVSQGHNLDDDNTCGLFQAGDVPNILDAMLGPLANNGGTTQTLALLAGSPAVNAGNPATCLATDQRGFGRAGICDIGAFERNGVLPP